MESHRVNSGVGVGCSKGKVGIIHLIHLSNQVLIVDPVTRCGSHIERVHMIM